MLELSERFDLVIREVAIGGERFELTMIADLEAEVDRVCREAAAKRRPGGQLKAFARSPYFGVLWPSARALARWLQERERLAGRSVLEIGCGLALPSLVAARAGARVVASDSHPDVPVFLRENQRWNGVSLEFRFADWRKPEIELGAFDRVVASEVLYEEDLVSSLPGQLARHLAPGGRIVIADPGRGHLDEFVAGLVRLGFSAREEEVHAPPCAADLSIQGPEENRDIRIVAFQRR